MQQRPPLGAAAPVLSLLLLSNSIGCGGAGSGTSRAPAMLAPVPPGLPCRPGGADAGVAPCEPGFACERVDPLPEPICTRGCDTFADCEAAGLADGCCMPRPGAPSVCVGDVYGDEVCPGPGDPCPLGTGCPQGTECWFVASANTLLCTGRCESDADCFAAGVPDACCAEVRANNVPSDLCLPRSLGLCPPIGPGGPCPYGTGCREDLQCWYLATYNELQCTVLCPDDDECQGLGFEDGCCRMTRGTQGEAPMCLPARLGACGPVAAEDGGP